jgi:membrane-associated phospholipid phosphatase
MAQRVAMDSASPSGLGRIPRFILDWLPMFIVLFAYDAIHNQFGALLPRAHTLTQIRIDEALFGTPVPAVAMQRAFYSPGHPHWWDFAALVVYTTHFTAVTLIAVILWVRSRPAYLRFMTWFVGLTTLGFITYALYPAVPPWLASQHGDLAYTHRVVRELWDYLGCHSIASMFSGANVRVNDVAAIPSLHAAYPVMIAMCFWRRSSASLRVVLALYPLAMAIALVYTGEHYVFDILLGVLYAVVSAFIMQRAWPVAQGRGRPDSTV